MSVRTMILVAGLILAAPAFAQPSAQQAAQNATNWGVFLKLYPARAIAAHEEGTVGFTVTLNNKGDVTGCQVTRSSGHPLLDQDTCKLITLNAVFQPDPLMGPSQTKTSQGEIDWKLPTTKENASAGGTPAVVADNGTTEKVVCKKTQKTGSFAGYERTCLTPSQWAKQSQEMTADWEDLQGKKGSTSGH